MRRNTRDTLEVLLNNIEENIDITMRMKKERMKKERMKN